MPITIFKKELPDDDLIIIPRREYERLKADQIPTVYLQGKAAKRLDTRVAASLRAHRQGKTRLTHTLADLISE